MNPPRRCAFLVPGDWRARTGGYGYDRRIAQELRGLGWTVDVHHLQGDWPGPDAAARAGASARIAALADGSLVLADGLAYGVLADEIRPHAQRLRWVALVHHPLHLETGLDAGARERLRAQEAAALRLARLVVATGPATVSDLAAMGVPTGHMAVVEPGTDPVVCAPARAIAHGGGVRLLCVATLTPRKGHAVLLQALEGLLHRAWSLHCVGSPSRDPETAARLHAQASALGGRVHWHGELDDAAVQAHYAAADVFVLPSWHEGYGMAVAEALAHGVPVVASRAGALARTLPPQAGLHVPAGDAEALRDALARVIADTALRERLAEGARVAGRELPDWPRQAAALARALEQVP